MGRCRTAVETDLKREFAKVLLCQVFGRAGVKQGRVGLHHHAPHFWLPAAELDQLQTIGVSHWFTAGEAQLLPGEGNKLPDQFL
jgi:hypothetical protein